MKSREVREPAVAYGKSKFTEEEYLQMEREAEEKHEFYRGEIFRMHGHGDLLAMSGAGENHNEIFSNLFTSIGSQLKGKSCKPYGPDMRMHIPENTLYTYPDIAIYCKPPTEGSDNVLAFRINENGHWELEEFKTVDQTLEIKAVNVSMTLKEIYEEAKMS